MIPGEALTENQQQQLLQLREQLVLFRTVSCRLAHEQISGITACNGADEDASSYHFQRDGLCRPELRKMTLGCAHTGANDRFCQLIDKAFATGLLNATISPSLTLNEIIVAIYKMDHEKGDLEKELAIARYNNHHETIRALEHELAELVTRHTNAISRLEKIRYGLMEQIDAAILPAKHHQSVPV
ncbi:hypothetical protein [Sediminibacterium ginsengisoli]|uniref:Uncharacterized protein n=1 Tax=Sediminibacterium ginsengisoli TaxID=413434 RepID=A0A1T4RR53_9BACT|nr:hypothetical protein [Sediminibacterium ginsengisoli]SKA18423.1 hypothetical protein SAMN04488132_11419 [Sediminibacterium ginsengisoli]